MGSGLVWGMGLWVLGSLGRWGGQWVCRFLVRLAIGACGWWSWENRGRRNQGEDREEGEWSEVKKQNGGGTGRGQWVEIDLGMEAGLWWVLVIGNGKRRKHCRGAGLWACALWVPVIFVLFCFCSPFSSICSKIIIF